MVTMITHFKKITSGCFTTLPGKNTKLLVAAATLLSNIAQDSEAVSISAD